MRCLRSHKNAVNHLVTQSGTPVIASFCSSMEWSTLSKALLKSSISTRNTFPWTSSPCCQWCTNSTSAWTAELPLTDPYWWGSVSSLIVSVTHWHVNPSRIFARTGVREIGLMCLWSQGGWINLGQWGDVGRFPEGWNIPIAQAAVKDGTHGACEQRGTVSQDSVGNAVRSRCFLDVDYHLISQYYWNFETWSVYVADGRTQVNLSTLPFFQTGPDRIPPLGFTSNLGIEVFTVGPGEAFRLLTVSTCSLVLSLPRGCDDTDEFSTMMDKVIMELGGFHAVWFLTTKLSSLLYRSYIQSSLRRKRIHLGLNLNRRTQLHLLLHVSIEELNCFKRQ